MEIRFGRKEDAQKVTEIFNYYILNTNSRFETEVFSVENRMEWMKQFDESTCHKLFVAIEDERVIGFACSQPYRDSDSFSETVEVTIYLKPDIRTKGIGSLLYSTLFDSLSDCGLHRALSGIALPHEASIALHKKFGFTEIGVFNEYAKKNGKYISSIWLEKAM